MPVSILVSIFNRGADGDVYAFAIQPDGKILVGGNFTTLGGVPRNRIGRLNADGSLDDGFNPDANNMSRRWRCSRMGRSWSAASSRRCGGGTRNRIARLNAGGSLDDTFNPGANDFVYALALQPGGKVLAVGAFTTMGGGGLGQTPRNRIARLNADGSLDASFNPGANDWVLAVTLQPDGRILVGGSFTMLGGGGTGTTPRNHIGRLNPDGSLDASFDPGANDFVVAMTVQADGKILVGGNFTLLGGGGRGTTLALHLGRLRPTARSISLRHRRERLRVRAAGASRMDRFWSAATLRCCPAAARPGAVAGIARLNDGQCDRQHASSGMRTPYRLRRRDAGGREDPGRRRLHVRSTAHAETPDRATHRRGPMDGVSIRGPTMSVYSHRGPTGREGSGRRQVHYVGPVGGQTPRSRIGRLNADGSLDNSFDAGANDEVFAMAVQPDGKILVGGAFSMLGGGPTGLNAAGRSRTNHRRRLVRRRLQSGCRRDVFAMALQADGKILVGGDFTIFGNGATTPRADLARLNADGSLDASFDPGANGFVNALAVQPDGKILAGGFFTMIGGGGTGKTPRNASAGSTPTARSTPPSIRARTPTFIQTLAVQADGNILVGGGFTALSDMTVASTRAAGSGGSPPMVRSTSASFRARTGPSSPWRFRRMAKIVAGGSFSKLGGGGSGTSMRPRIGRLTNTGRCPADPRASRAAGASLPGRAVAPGQSSPVSPSNRRSTASRTCRSGAARECRADGD